MKQTIKLKIEGMHCPSCVMNINGVLEDLKGVISADTNFARSEVSVEFNPEKLKKERILSEVRSLGYKAVFVQKIRNDEDGDAGENNDRSGKKMEKTGKNDTDGGSSNCEEDGEKVIIIQAAANVFGSDGGNDYQGSH